MKEKNIKKMEKMSRLLKKRSDSIKLEIKKAEMQKFCSSTENYKGYSFIVKQSGKRGVAIYAYRRYKSIYIGSSVFKAQQNHKKKIDNYESK